MSERKYFFLLLCLIAIGEVLAFFGVTSSQFPSVFTFPFYEKSLFFTLSLIASVIIWAAYKKTVREFLFVGLVPAFAMLSSIYIYLYNDVFQIRSFLALLALSFYVVFTIMLKRIFSSSGEEKENYIDILCKLLLLPLFVLSSSYYLSLTALIFPTTNDLLLYELSNIYFPATAQHITQFFYTYDLFLVAIQSIYIGLPIFVAMIYFVAKRNNQVNRVIPNFLNISVFGYIGYFILPASGPNYLFSGAYPFDIPVDVLNGGYDALVTVFPRNAFPSLHTAWGLLLILSASGFRACYRYLFYFLGISTILSSVATGEHYLIDLIVSFPLVVLTLIAFDDALREKLKSIFVAALVCVISWFVLVKSWAILPAASIILVILTVVSFVVFIIFFKKYQAIQKRTVVEKDWNSARVLGGPSLIPEKSIFLLFLTTGFAALIYQVVYSKVLALIFGSTAIATYTVLATYMGGMALGSWLGGIATKSRYNPLIMYAVCESIIAIFCFFTPFYYDILKGIYIDIAFGVSPDAPVLTFYRTVLGSLLLLLPTILMGMTLPILNKYLETTNKNLGVTSGWLYVSNVFGAALGALLTGYMLLPVLGIKSTLTIAVVLNLSVAFFAYRKSKSVLQPKRGDNRPITEKIVNPIIGEGNLASITLIGFISLFVVGFVSLSLEVFYVHMLAVVAGNSTYAFSLMLFAFLLGLAFGADAARRIISRGYSVTIVMSIGLLGLMVFLAIGILVMDQIPSYFASFSQYPYTRSFPQREFIRFIVCLLIMLPPAFFIGFNYPLSMQCIGSSFQNNKSYALGMAACLNTIGNILGVLVCGFVLLPYMGALKTAHVLSAIVACLIFFILGYSFYLKMIKFHSMAILILVTVILVIFHPKEIDYTKLASGANVYFQAQGYGDVIDHVESLDGGLTTVSTRVDRSGEVVYTLLTNGKFQGDDNKKLEMKSQSGFSLVPLLHTDKRERAAVIGFGTGVSARIFKDAGFQQLDIVELSGDIITMADKYFSKVNGGVIHKDGVDVYVTDGRNFLMLGDSLYDVIGMEITSIWFAGAASLYNQQFYQLLKPRLAKGGILQQWIQLHHIDIEDILYILGSLKSEFKYVRLYLVDVQGVIIASDQPFDNRSEYEQLLMNTESLDDIKSLWGGSYSHVLDKCLLSNEELEKFLAVHSNNGVIDFVSTDNNMFLEYHTPKGNVETYIESINRNISYLSQYSGDDCR